MYNPLAFISILALVGLVPLLALWLGKGRLLFLEKTQE
jgi:hypothetical protein